MIQLLDLMTVSFKDDKRIIIFVMFKRRDMMYFNNYWEYN